jgi:hypothetical protein
MPVKEILRAVIFCHRIADDKDFNDTVNCIPDSRMKYLEAGLLERKAAGEIDTVQIGRHRYQASAFDEYSDEIDRFFAKLDLTRSHSSTNRVMPSEGVDDGLTPSETSNFTGFDDVNETSSQM